MSASCASAKRPVALDDSFDRLFHYIEFEKEMRERINTLPGWKSHFLPSCISRGTPL